MTSSASADVNASPFAGGPSVWRDRLTSRSTTPTARAYDDSSSAVDIFSASVSGNVRISRSPQSSTARLFGMSGMPLIGMSGNHGCSRITSIVAIDHRRRPSRQSWSGAPPASVSSGGMGTAHTASCISASTSSLLVTYRYSDMVVKPSSLAIRLMDTAPSPSASASSIAVSTMRSTLSSRLGPRCGRSATPQLSATARGSTSSTSSAIAPPSC
ncbi:hypothetical protein A0130_16885 [Leifsonia xyli]|nr:hypothetical protein A0130_16885 [Leifsonia xyli]